MTPDFKDRDVRQEYLELLLEEQHALEELEKIRRRMHELEDDNEQY